MYIYIYIYNTIKYDPQLYHLNIYNVYMCIIKVKLEGLEVPFKKNSLGEKNNY